MEKIPSSREAAKGTPFEGLYDTPKHWPENIHRLPTDLFDDIGRDARTNQLYWDGEALVTERRFSNFERGLAVTGLAIAFVGVAAGVVQAWAAVSSFSGPSNFQFCVEHMTKALEDAGALTTANRLNMVETCSERR